MQTKLHCGLKIQSECRLCETSLDWIGLDWVDWVRQGGLRVVATHSLQYAHLSFQHHTEYFTLVAPHSMWHQPVQRGGVINPNGKIFGKYSPP